MTEEPQSSSPPQAPPQRAAPPTSPGIAERRPVVWPTVIGIILIIVGAGGALSGLWGFIGAWVMTALLPAMAEMEEMQEAIAYLGAWQHLLSAITLALGVFCGLAGVGMVRRRRWSIGATKAWSILKIVIGIAVAGVAAMVQAEAMRNDLNASGGAGSPFAGMASAMAVVTFVLSAAWSAALPVFLLLWLKRSAVKLEIAGWSPISPSEGR